MVKVIGDITMSLDGYIAGLGADGEMDRLQAWVMKQDPVDAEVLQQATAATGAVVMGRRFFDIVDSPGVWTNDMAYGAAPPGPQPYFVVTHRPPVQKTRLQRELGLEVTFVDDLRGAIDQARVAAATRKGHVVIAGGGSVVGQGVEQRLVDELHLHLAPLLLGGGIPLFRGGTRQSYRQVSARQSAHALQLVYGRQP